MTSSDSTQAQILLVYFQWYQRISRSLRGSYYHLWDALIQIRSCHLKRVALYHYRVVLFREDVMEFLYGESLVDKKWWCRYSNTFYLREQISDTSELHLMIDKVHLRREKVEIDIQYAIRARSVVDIFFDLPRIFYAYHTPDKARVERRTDIVPDITGVIRILPCIVSLCYRFFSIEGIGIWPEIWVLIDMDELTSWCDDSIAHHFEPEVEGMIMIIEDGNLLLSWWAA